MHHCVQVPTKFTDRQIVKDKAQRFRIIGLACNHTMDRITFCRQFVFFDHIFLMIFGEKWWCPWIAVFSSGCIAHYFESRSRLLTLHSPELWTYITLVSFINQIATIANSSFRLVPFFPRLPSLLRDTWQLYTPSLFTGAPNISLKTKDKQTKLDFNLLN